MHGPTCGSCPMTLRVIGDFEFRCDGEIVSFPPTAQRVIGLLALHRGRPVRRAAVSGTLWPETTDPHASARLRTAIWRTPVDERASPVAASHTHLWLRPEVDVDLDRATARAHDVLAVAPADGAAGGTVLGDGLDVFTDDVLVGWDDQWVLPERERFRQLRLHVLDRLAELLLASRRYGEAVQFGLAAVAAEPLRESGHRLVVRAHVCEGNLAEAMRQYRGYADLLSRELQVRPSAAMEDLVRGALADASRSTTPTPRPAPADLRADVRTQPGRQRQPDGRQPELAISRGDA